MTTDAPPPTYDTRKTSPEKLTKLRELANEMLVAAAREPDNEAFKRLTLYAEKMHRVLDGDW